MEQLTQKLKNGEMQLLEVPFPLLSSGSILVRNHYSLISAGTEGKTVKDARLGFIAKARARKAELKKVLNTAKNFGIYNTYKMVMNRLDAPSPLGYSCAGEVIGVADDVTDFAIGDLVACGGATAVHAEVVAVPVNLCVKIPAGVPADQAAFTTIGAIAMQGVRQADLRLGEHCIVIGLGLVGQMTLQLLNASGIRATGIDIDDRQVQLAVKSAGVTAVNRQNEDLEQIIYNITNGYGADAVIITAATDSTDPVDLAGALCRRKGKVILVGAVPAGFSRKNYYIKELDLRMSGSYGPGRYDDEYEQKGIDYPYAYVRWTENRNMQAFADLLSSGKLNIAPLLTHTFPFKDAPQAYDLILNRTEPFAGIVLKYETDKPLRSAVIVNEKKSQKGEVNAALIGAGSFAQNILLPALKSKVNFVSLLTNRPANSRHIAEKYSFSTCTSAPGDIFNDSSVNTVFIATRHDTHAEYIKQTLRQGKNVFCEKPMCIRPEDLEEIRDIYNKGNSLLMIGFNRRFSPHARYIKKSIGPDALVAINYRINAGMVPYNHWVHDKETGGGRIIGEVCHFIDICSWLCSSPVKTVSANALPVPHNTQDTLTIQLKFENGSIASVSYYSNGSRELSKEYLEVFSNGRTFVSDDFSELYIYGKKRKKALSGMQDKGHKDELMAFIESVKQGKASPIPFSELYNTTAATFKVLESISLNGRAVEV